VEQNMKMLTAIVQMKPSCEFGTFQKDHDKKSDLIDRMSAYRSDMQTHIIEKTSNMQLGLHIEHFSNMQLGTIDQTSS
jgi:hypothetical protein